MKVINIVVTCDKEYFIDLIIKELINHNISYVLIDNEFHFEDKIYRIFDEKNYQKDLFIKLPTEGISLVDIVNPNDYNLKDYNLDEHLLNIKQDEPSIASNLSTDKPKINKRYIKEQNRQYIKQLKNNFRNKRK